MAASKANPAKKTKYQKLVSIKKSYCKGKALATSVKAAAKIYIEDAVKKGKPEAEAKKIAARVQTMACNISGGYVAGKKKKPAKRKAAVGAQRVAVAKVGRPKKRK